MSRTLVIDNYDSYTYIIYQNIWKLSGIQPLLIKNDELDLDSIENLDFQNIIISPGPGTPTNPIDIGICEELLDRFPNTPLLGVCLGHQLLGHHFGGKIIHAPEPMHGKYSRVNLVDSPLFEGIPTQVEVVRYHSLLIDAANFPPSLEIIAETEGDQLIMGVQHKERPFFGLQFHPESIGTAYGEQMFANFLKLSSRWIRDRSFQTPEPSRIFRCSVLKWEEPDHVFAQCFASEDYAYWLDSSLQSRNGRFSFMGKATEIISLEKGALSILPKNPAANGQAHFTEEALFDYLNEKIKTESVQKNDHPLPFQGGWLGYIGYETTQHLDLGLTGYNSSYPQSLFMWAEQFLAFDYQKQELFVCSAVADKSGHEKWLAEIQTQLEGLEALDNLTIEKSALPQVQNQLALRAQLSKEAYMRDIRAIQQLIFDGETYETCLTNEFETQTELDPFWLYRILRLSNPAPYSAYLQMPELSILSSSPESFCTIDATGRIKSEPIKGTRPLGTNKSETARLVEELKTSTKDHAELLMIIDLIRNDLSMICEPGSVKVPELIRISEYATVLQASSLIEGHLLEDISAVDALKAIFPGGSITGAPKRRTMQIIDRYEKRPRGVYTGCIGYFSLDRAADFNIAIRTMVYEKEQQRISFGSGGAILTDSVPEEEYDEILIKAYALLRALNLACYKEFDHYRLVSGNPSPGRKSQPPLIGNHKSMSMEELFRLSTDKIEL